MVQVRYGGEGAIAFRATAGLVPIPPRWRQRRGLCHPLPVRSSIKGTAAAILLTVRRRCLVCDYLEERIEPEDTDLIGPPCTRCHAPSERVEVLTRRTFRHEPNPHAAALGRLGGLKGGPARAAALSARRRRAIARMAAKARWGKGDAEE
jgi:hypothetical protein